MCKSLLSLPPSLSLKAGANMIVSGSAVVKSSDPKAVIDQLRAAVNKWAIAEAPAPKPPST